MQEFTYMLLEAKRLQDKPEPLGGPVGQTVVCLPRWHCRRSELAAYGHARLAMG